MQKKERHFYLALLGTENCMISDDFVPSSTGDTPAVDGFEALSTHLGWREVNLGCPSFQSRPTGQPKD